MNTLYDSALRPLKRRAGPRDLLFSELLLWEWLRRVRVERQLSGAVGALGLSDAETRLEGDGVEVAGERRAAQRH